jgi:hypothetical protein
VLGCTYTCECVGVREWMWLNVCGSTCESVCLAANIHVNVCVREWMCLNVRETTCESVCLGAHIHVNVWVFVNGCG